MNTVREMSTKYNNRQDPPSGVLKTYECFKVKFLKASGMFPCLNWMKLFTVQYFKKYFN